MGRSANVHDFSGEATGALQTARAGKVVGQVLEGQVAFPLVIRYARDEQASDLDAVGSTMIEAALRSQASHFLPF